MLRRCDVCAWGCGRTHAAAAAAPTPTDAVAPLPLRLPQPFFSLLLSLGGALTWFPLNIATPHLAYRAVYRPTGAKSALMWLVFWGTFAASAAAAVASVRQIVQGWTDVVFFE